MRKHNKNDKYLDGLNLTCLKALDKKIYISLSKYILENKEIWIYAIIDKNILKSPNFNIKDLEKFILRNYLEIDIINGGLDDDMYKSKNISDDKIYIRRYGNNFDKFVVYSRKELSNLIINHNKNLVIPSSNEYLLEKKKIIDWYSYNTPIMNDPTITPMTGTASEDIFPTAKAKYIEWIIASSYLLKEFNIWMKAKYYFENKDSGLEFSSIDFKQAYSYFIYRQFKINLSKSSFDQKDAFIWDFYVDDIFYRELYEDILYILLNLLLADKIVGNEALVNSLDNDNKFFGILEGIIKDHYDQNKEGYDTLKNLRWFFCNNYLTANQIKNVYKKAIE